MNGREMNGKVKINPIPFKVHPSFKELVDDIQNEKIVQGIDKISKKTSKHIITKQMTNLVNANPKIKQRLIEVKTNKNAID